MSDDEPRRFPTTAWSIVDDARDGTEQQRAAALDRFARNYWRPVYFFLRTQGRSAELAQDSTQDFFLRFLDHNWITRADRERGKFRSYVLMTLKGFLSDQSPERGRRQPHFESRILPLPMRLSDEDLRFEPSDDESPERIFMRSWAESLLATVGAKVEAELRLQGRHHWHDAFRRAYVIEDASQAEIAQQLGLTREQFRHAVRQVRRRYSELLRREVAEQVTESEDVEAELQELLRLLGSNSEIRR